MLTAGTTEGTVLLPVAFKLYEFPIALRGVPAFASSIKDFTCHTKQGETLANEISRRTKSTFYSSCEQVIC